MASNVADAQSHRTVQQDLIPMASEWHDRILMAIPSIDGGHLLERMLPTVRLKPANIIVLDQGSSDDTERVCRAAGVELLQLGTPHTYTQASNIGAQIARERNFPFLCISNNDIVFRTDVLAELLGEMDRDPRLGIVAPSQIILDPASGLDVLARRVFWNLHTLDFLHDASDVPATPRIDADFCELTCALIRMGAVKEVGFLDDAFGFYHEDADFCFRLRKHGYGAAYLPRSQIVHYTSSTFARKRQAQIDYLARNRAYFARKHIGYGVRLADDQGSWPGEADTVARRLRPLLTKFGLVNDARPELVFGQIGPITAHYLLTTQVSPLIPRVWRAEPGRFKAILAASDPVVQSLRSAGLTSFRVPLGIDVDIFNPWGLSMLPRRNDERTYLVISPPHDKRPLEAVMHAWSRFAVAGRKVRLIVAGTGLARCIPRRPETAYRSGHVEISCYPADRLELHEPMRPLTDEELAALYRSADYTIVGAADGSSLTLLESLACGTPVVFDGSGTVALLYREAIGTATLPESQVGEADGLVAALERSERRSAVEWATLAEAGRYGVLGYSTVRHSVMAVRHALKLTQDSDQGRAAGHVALPASAAASAAAAGMAPQTSRLRSRLSSAAGRRLAGVAMVAARFGTVWQERGLPAAVSLSAQRIRGATERRLPPSPPPPAPSPRVGPARLRQSSPLLIGYIDAQLGIGQSLRGLAAAIATTGSPFGIYPFGIGVEERRSVPFMTERYDEVTPHDVNIIEVSPAELPRVFANVSKDHFEGSYNILRTYWELARGPAIWRENHGMEGIDEIWAPNAFCAEAFRDFFDGPITVVPPCIVPATPVRLVDRGRFGLDSDVFYFMFSFDYYSFPERKNPLAVVRAFLTAFPDTGRQVGLVVKATGAVGHFPAVKKDIMAAARTDGRIAVIDESLSRDDMTSLMAGIDCYVSLHRSEGFGLGMAEAMALEKPVIATAYSGNAEFVTQSTGFPIPFTLKPVRPHEYVHAGDQVWAEPDEDACSAAMRLVVDDKAEAASRAKAGRAFVEHRYGPANVGRLAIERLDAIRRTHSKTP